MSLTILPTSARRQVLAALLIAASSVYCHAVPLTPPTFTAQVYSGQPWPFDEVAQIHRSSGKTLVVGLMLYGSDNNNPTRVLLLNSNGSIIYDHIFEEEDGRILSITATPKETQMRLAMKRSDGNGTDVWTIKAVQSVVTTSVADKVSPVPYRMTEDEANEQAKHGWVRVSQDQTQTTLTVDYFAP